MVKQLWQCEVCGEQYEEEIEAFKCEASTHGMESVEPLELDRFYTIMGAAEKLDISFTAMQQWVYRHGKVFCHMIDLKIKADERWASRYHPEMIEGQFKGSPPRFWIPERDLHALQKAMQLFGSINGMRRSGVESVYTLDGGAFWYPSS